MNYSTQFQITLIIGLGIFLSGLRINAQDYVFKNFTFDDEKIILPSNLTLENEVILLKEIKKEIVSTEEGAFQFSLTHEQILLNSDQAIERNNRVYIPYSLDESLIDQQLRVHFKDGRIIDLANKDIKEEIDDETKVKYNYYAIDGLEKGAIIEKFYILREGPDLNGKTIKMQSKYPILKTSFELIYDNNLEFKSKSYNGLPESIITKDAYEGKTSLTVVAENVDPLPENEKYANDATHHFLLRYKLYGNNWAGTKNINNYKEFAGNVYNILNPELSEKEQKTLNNFIKTIPISDNLNGTLKNIENKLKNTLRYDEYYGNNKHFLDALNNKQINSIHLLQLYNSIFENLKIERQMVMTSKRFEVLFDKDFESLDQLSDVIFYFPTIKQYLEPQATEYRMPLFNFNYGFNYGLFIKTKEFGGIKMGIGEIGFIEIPGSEITHDETKIEIDFTQDLENPTIHTIHTQGGYSAAGYQIIKDYVPADRYEEIIKNIAQNFTNESEYTSLKVSNDGGENIGNKPLIFDLTFEGKDLIQKANGNILCNVGTLIGAQLQMYQIEKRVLPVEIYYPHSYNRTMKIKLPEGYEIKNMEDFNLEYTTKEDNKTVAYWHSEATAKDNIVSVSNTEFYNAMVYNLDIFEQYKEVVNAAADFNKIVIVVGKK